MNKKSLTITAAAGGAVLVLALGIFIIPRIIPRIIPGGFPNLMAGAAASGGVPQQISCVRLATLAREQSINQANLAYEQAMNNAYMARATGFRNAYSQTTWAAVTPAVQSTLNAFNLSLAQARATLQSADAAAATAYTAAVTPCVPS